MEKSTDKSIARSVQTHDRPPEYTGIEDALRTLLREVWEMKQAVARLEAGRGSAAAIDPDKPLTTAEAAAYMGCSLGHVRNLTSNKRIPYHKPGGATRGRMYFRREELDEYLFRNKTAADYEIEDKATEIVNKLRR
jgi:excisionase family DNA binding protein